MRATLVRRGLWDRITSGLAGRRMVGTDLSGNKYYELPSPAGGRTKRVVEYADSAGSYAYSSVDDWRQGTAQLPVQWSAWLSHTRAGPPSMAELQVDAARQTRLRARVAEIEERERLERIAQGFLLPDGTEPEVKPPGVAAPASAPAQVQAEAIERAQQRGAHAQIGSAAPQRADSTATAASASPGESPEWTSADGTPHASSRFAFPPAPGTPERGGVRRKGVKGGGSARRAAARAPAAAETSPATSPAPAPAADTGPGNPLAAAIAAAAGKASTSPGAPSAGGGVAPPRPKVDPTQTPSSDLRKLAEEDTKRRLRESGASEDTAASGPAVAGVGRSLKPKRRGRG